LRAADAADRVNLALSAEWLSTIRKAPFGNKNCYFDRTPMAVANFKSSGHSSFHREQMISLIRFTGRTLTSDMPVPFGAMVVATDSGETLVRTVNQASQKNDPTCHAEVNAIRQACKRIKNHLLRGYTLYTTCEPCPMCMGAILWAGLDRVVYGATIAHAARHCNQIYIPASELVAKSDMRCEVIGPIEAELCYSSLFSHPNMIKRFKIWRSNNR
jgi:tRNA(Arg) A34 adenosine deaminase TadA